MRPAEELRYLILAIQREGNRIFAAKLRPLGVTPSQAEILRVLAEFQPLTLSGLGELLVCETGDNPSRLVDRLVRAGIVNREIDPFDRRHVALTLTPAGRRLARKTATIEQQLHQWIDTQVAGQPLGPTITLLRAFANSLPAGQALVRRRELGADDERRSR